ncbi:MAG: hypothetical protein JWM27_277, partial [Gemmatimonadetes bacterium]|nr:hypothetical protein [Gemmatimonadota bacterium]
MTAASTSTPVLVVSVVDVNGNGTEARDACVRLWVAAGAEAECGDLVVSHGLPAVRTLNAVRSPVLLYNSRTQHPYPIVSVNVTLPLGWPAPDSVVGVLRMGGAELAHRGYPGTAFPAGQTERIALTFDAGTYNTSLYSYQVEVYAWYGPGRELAYASSELAIVNRAGSALGAGWDIAGHERMYVEEGGFLFWVGGDGGTAVFRQKAGSTTVWMRDPGARPDSVVKQGAQYVRALPGGARVVMDGAG